MKKILSVIALIMILALTVSSIASCDIINGLKTIDTMREKRKQQ